MTESANRKLEKNEYVYVLDSKGYSYDEGAFCKAAYVVRVDNKHKNYTVLVYEDKHETYSFNDYGLLIFRSQIEAEKAARALPKPGEIVYQIIGNKIYKRQINCLFSDNSRETIDLILSFTRGKDVSFREIGKSIFFSKEEAEKKLFVDSHKM